MNVYYLKKFRKEAERRFRLIYIKRIGLTVFDIDYNYIQLKTNEIKKETDLKIVRHSFISYFAERQRLLDAKKKELTRWALFACYMQNLSRPLEGVPCIFILQ